MYVCMYVGVGTRSLHACIHTRTHIHTHTHTHVRTYVRTCAHLRVPSRYNFYFCSLKSRQPSVNGYRYRYQYLRSERCEQRRVYMRRRSVFSYWRERTRTDTFRLGLKDEKFPNISRYRNFVQFEKFSSDCVCMRHLDLAKRKCGKTALCACRVKNIRPPPVCVFGLLV